MLQGDLTLDELCDALVMQLMEKKLLNQKYLVCL